MRMRIMSWWVSFISATVREQSVDWFWKAVNNLAVALLSQGHLKEVGIVRSKTTNDPSDRT